MICVIHAYKCIHEEAPILATSVDFYKLMMMMLTNSYIEVVNSELTCASFLQDHMHLSDADANDPCAKCGSEMSQKRRENRQDEWKPVMRCIKKGSNDADSEKRQCVLPIDRSERHIELVYLFIIR